MRDDAGEVFDYAICDNCQSAYATTFPKNIAAYYANYYSFDDVQSSRLKQTILRLSAKVIDTLNRQRVLNLLTRVFLRNLTSTAQRLLSPNLQAFFYSSPALDMRMAEVGAGNGQFVEQLSSLGYTSTSGVDLFYEEEKSVKSYMKRGTVHELAGLYDLLLFNHCFEHADDPETVMSQCNRLLTPKGKLVIHIPNIHSVEFAAYQSDWWGFHAPYHFGLPSERGLEEMARRNGLTISDEISTSRYDHYLYSEDYKNGIHDASPLS
jgi:2-polyprenyl-3-methyl-5-hydroxy-6-metoxy-1,4-benzoquinol methylase